MYELLQKKFFTGSKPLEPNAVMNSQREVIQYVSDTSALGRVCSRIASD